MNDPRNVTPDSERVHVPDAEGMTRDSARSDWTGFSVERRGRDIPWLGILLVLVGVALTIQYFYPRVAVGTLILLAIGLAFLAGWLFGRSWVSMVPGVLFMALGTAELVEDLALLGPAGQDVAGLASTALAVGFLIIWLTGRVSGRRSSWPLWGAAIFGLIGLAQLSGRLINLPILGFVWPILIIIVGIVVIAATRRR